MKKKIIIFGVLFLILNCVKAQQTKTFDAKRDLDLVHDNRTAYLFRCFLT